MRFFDFAEAPKRTKFDGHTNASLSSSNSRFVPWIGVRFHCTATNAIALNRDEEEVRFLGSIDHASDHAKRILEMVNDPQSWARTKFEASIPILIWVVGLEQMIKVGSNV